MELAILARHGESSYSARAAVNGDPALACPLTEQGEREAALLGEALAAEPVELAVVTRFARTRQTAELALAGRDVPRLVVPELDDPRVGDFEGSSLEEYRAWAWAHGSDAEPPGGGDSRAALAARYARGFRLLLERPERLVLVVAHALPIAYALDAAAGQDPEPRVRRQVAHAEPHRLAAAELAAAADRLERWSGAPTW